jgi:putative transposase
MTMNASPNCSIRSSTGPFFVEKVRDVVGLYLNPPDKPLVLCVDEKSQIQALERRQPILPIGLGYVEGVTHGYYQRTRFHVHLRLPLPPGRTRSNTGLG